jgi:hypothetical protein
MIITKKHIPRRTFLRGAGVTLALPFLESMLPAQTPLSQTAGARPTRFVGLFIPHGWTPSYWMPYSQEDVRTKRHYSGMVTGTPGVLQEMPFVFKPIEAYKEHMTLIAGVDAKSSFPPPDTSGGFHARGAGYLTAYRLKKTTGLDIDVGMATADQQIAQKIGQDTLLPSIQFGIEDPGGSEGTCGWGYSCAYMNSISWADRHSPLPMEISPRVIFDRMFGAGRTPEERELRRRTRSSVLDAVREKVNGLKTDLPPSDRTRLDHYLENVREIERRLDIAGKSSHAVPSIDVPYGIPETFEEHIKLNWDLMIAAFQGDISRVTTMMYARELSSSNYPKSGTVAGNHAASHHGEDDKRRHEHALISRYMFEASVHFLDKLKNTPDGDGSLLDHTLVMWGSNLGKAAAHNHTNVGHILFGGASGKHKGGGRYLIHTGPGANGNGSNAELLMTVMDMFGVHHQTLGDENTSRRVQL